MEVQEVGAKRGEHAEAIPEEASGVERLEEAEAKIFEDFTRS